MHRALILPLLALPAVAACGSGGTAPPAEERRTAPGEVLGGEVSDAMLPLDTATSTSPSDRTAVTATGTEATGGAKPAPDLPAPEASGGPEPLPANLPAEDAPLARAVIASSARFAFGMTAPR